MKPENLRKKEYLGDTLHMVSEKKEFVGESSAHFHDFFEIELVANGTGTQILNGEEYTLKRGSIYLLSPRDFHRVKADGSMTIFNLMFDETILRDELISDVSNLEERCCFSLSEDETKRMETIFSLLTENVRSEDEYSVKASGSLIEYMILHLLRIAKEQGKNAETARRSKISRALNYIYSHLSESPSLLKVSEACGYSANYFSRLWREETGKGFSQFINSLKITRAKTLLSDGNRSISEITQLCGYSSKSNFYRAFRSEVGTSPLEYKKRTKETF